MKEEYKNTLKLIALAVIEVVLFGLIIINLIR